jgi:hypothetical protein
MRLTLSTGRAGHHAVSCKLANRPLEWLGMDLSRRFVTSRIHAIV